MTFSSRAIEAAEEAACQCDNMFREVFDRYDRADIIRAALSAALAVDGMALQVWQPIESAPKDGTRILWSCGDDKMSVIHWPEYELCFEGGYWMPLPPPPAASDREERRLPPKEKP